ncbi:MAG: hypothetical protein JSS20_07250 [Proteobacteria bacterium]|nr:hypothetical protein [Pseudomonadota bacterium]
MAYASRVVLISRSGPTARLERLVEDFLRDRVGLVAVAGVDCQLIEDTIDEIVVGNGTDDSRFLITLSHPGSTIEDVLEFVRNFGSFYGSTDEREVLSGEPDLVEL